MYGLYFSHKYLSLTQCTGKSSHSMGISTITKNIYYIYSFIITHTRSSLDYFFNLFVLHKFTCHKRTFKFISFPSTFCIVVFRFFFSYNFSRLLHKIKAIYLFVCFGGFMLSFCQHKMNTRSEKEELYLSALIHMWYQLSFPSVHLHLTNFFS